MRLMSLPLLLLVLLQAAASGGTQQQADAARQGYEEGARQWSDKLKTTAGEERKALLAARPDPTVAGRKVWAAIQTNLQEDWTLDDAAWLVRTSPKMTVTDEHGTRKPAMSDAVLAIRSAAEKYHLKSPKLKPYCLALVALNDPGALPQLRKIESDNPDVTVQGVAALAQAMLMKGMGDDATAISRRLTLLRKAIINSADETVDGVEISKLARDEIQIIRFLSKGREAPEIEGVNSGGEKMTLSSYKGKVVILLFWTSESEDSQGMADMVHKMREHFSGQPFEVVGVNADSTEALRRMQADKQVRWPNFSDPDKKIAGEYRVGFWPLAYVLDAKGQIQYVGGMGSFVELTVEGLLHDK